MSGGEPKVTYEGVTHFSRESSLANTPPLTGLDERRTDKRDHGDEIDHSVR